MNLFDLFAKITLDTGEYDEGVVRARASFSSLTDGFDDVRSSADRAQREFGDLGSSASEAGDRAGSAANDVDDLGDVLEDTADRGGDLEDSLNQVDRSSRNMSDGLSTAKLVMADLISNGIQTAVSAFGNLISYIWNLDEATEEYRVAQGKLNTAFEAAGYSTETAQQAYRSFYEILGDTDTATEASQLLAKLALSEKDVATWTEIAAGVMGTFGDALPIEGLIESSNETAKVGQVTGSLADALNWAGISEDAFNDKLAACSSESERNQLIMETLSGTYDEASEAFYRNNDAMIASRNTQADLQKAMAEVGESISTVKNSLLQQLAPTLVTISERFANFIAGIDADALAKKIGSFVDIVLDNGPLITSTIAGIGTAFVSWKVTNLISGIASALTSLFVPATTAATGAQRGLNAAMAANPVGLVVTLVASLVTALITLWNTSEGFREAVGAIWDGITWVFSNAVELIKAAWSGIVDFFTGIWNGIQGVFSTVADVLGDFFRGAVTAIQTAWSTVVAFFTGIWDGIRNVFTVVASVLGGFFSTAVTAIQAAWSGITGFFSGIWNGIKKVFSVVSSVIGGFFGDAADAVQKAWDGITGFFSGIWEKIKDVFSNAWNAFKDIGRKIVDGLKQGISNAWEGLKSWFNGLWDGLFGNRTANVTVNKRTIETDGSHASGLSYVPWDGYIAELHRGEMVLTRSQAEALRRMDFGTANVSFASSGIGLSSAGVVNGISSAAKSGADVGNVTVNLVLPDGSKLASYLLGPLVNYAKANGTPILNPI